MELKRILARDSRSANEKAIQLYGPDVLIISSQKLDNQTELIVAVDLEAQVKPAEKALASRPPAQESALDSETPFVPFSKLFQSASAFVPLEPEDTFEAPPVTLAPEDSKASKPLTNVGLGKVAGQGDRGLSSTLLSSQAPSLTHAQHESQRSHEIVEMMRSEIAALRKEFSLSRQMQSWQDGLRLSPAVQQLVLAMTDAGVPAGLRGLLTDSIQSLDGTVDAIPVMHQLLADALAREQMDVPVRGVHAICGPSGAGKTAMVGRLAYAAAQLHGPDQQVMVSFADQRPGAWSQMQMLASQAGVTCYRAADSEMLQALLVDLEGKTVWIDTSGANFLGQAELLSRHHPQVLRHAVLPVDATVTSVQKILQQPQFTWTSLMLSKLDEAASPWALLQGLTENPVPVSCVSDGVTISQAFYGFDADRLIRLALLPFASGIDMSAVASVELLSESVDQPVAPVRVKKTAVVAPKKALVKAKAAAQAAVSAFSESDDFLIPTLLAASPAPRSRSRSANATSALKVVNG